MRVCAITTVDNPYDPIEDFVNWYKQDMLFGYNTCGRLARIDRASNLMSTVEQDIEHEKAIDRILTLDFLDLYVKIEREIEDPQVFV